jgi:hypothetical protein
MAITAADVAVDRKIFLIGFDLVNHAAWLSYQGFAVASPRRPG